jgi:hypothetical protein
MRLGLQVEGGGEEGRVGRRKPNVASSEGTEGKHERLTRRDSVIIRLVRSTQSEAVDCS